MKRFLLSSVTVAMCILSTLSALGQGQPPFPLGLLNSTGSNAFPWNSTVNKRTQFLIRPGDFGANIPGGRIDTLWFRSANTATGGPGTFSDLDIRMGQFTSTVFPGSGGLDFYTPAQLTTVLSAASYTINQTVGAGQWYFIPLQTPFIFDPNLTLCIDIDMSNRTSSTGFQSATFTVSGAPNHQRLTASTRTATTGSASTILSDIGLSVLPNVATDGALLSFFSPSGTLISGSSQPVSVRIQNRGFSNLTSATVNYQLDANAPVSQVWNGNLSTFQADSFAFSSPMTVPSTQTMLLRAWLSSVNGQGPDSNAMNDTIRRVYCLALPGGTYTVGGAGANFESVRDAVNALNCGGIAGAVTFQINPGTYHGTYTINNFPNPGNFTVNFIGLTGLPSDVILVHDTAGAATNRSHFIINASSRISFQALTFRRTINPAAAGQAALVYSSTASSGDVVGCSFVDVPQTNSVNNNAIVYRGSNGLFLNNNFNGFYYAIFLDGVAANTFVSNNTISTNTFVNNIYRSVYALNQASAIISGNQFSGFVSTSTAGASIWAVNILGTEISSNSILGAMSSSGIIISNPNMDTVVPTNVNRVFNNVISGFQSPSIVSSTLAITPISITGSFSATANAPANPRDIIEVINNTVLYSVATTSTSTVQACFYLTGGTVTTPAWARITVRNNHFEINPTIGSLPAAFRLFRLTDQSQLDSLTSSHNNFRIGGSTPPPMFRVNTPNIEHPTVAAWNAATGRDIASVSISANFLNPTLLIPTNIALDNLGTPVSYVANDVVGSIRSTTTPDIGAYEFQGQIFAQITHTPLADTLQTVLTRSLNASITDTASTIVPGTARVFYKKLSQSVWQVDSLPTVSGSDYTFTISHTALGGVAVFDTIEYYLAVRSALGVITTLPLGGTGLQTSNQIPPSSTFRYLILGNIAGTYRVGTSAQADFPSLTIAANFINSGLITGPSTFLLIDSVYNAASGEIFPITIMGRPGSSATNTITIRPDTSRSQVLVQGTFSGSNGLIVLRGADHLVINGSNNAANNRNLTIRNASTSDNTAAILVRSEIANPSIGVTLQNLRLEAGSNTVTSTFGIAASNAAISTSATCDLLQDFTIQNVEIKRAYFGVYLRGSTANPAVNLRVLDNVIGDTALAMTVNLKGIDIQNTINSLVQGNTIVNIAGLTSAVRSGIEMGGTASQNLLVNANRIDRVSTPAVSGANGLYVISGNGMTLTNNVISGVVTQNGSATSNTFNAFGIRLGSGTGHRVYYNTVHMSGNYANSSTSGAASAALNISSTVVTSVDVRNNIFSNSMSSVATGGQFFVAVWLPTNYPMPALIINNNAYHVDSTVNHMVGRVGTLAASPTYVDLPAWKQVTDGGIPGNDDLSVPVFGRSRAPFVSDTDLRIVPGTNTGIESGAVPIASIGLPNRDFNQTARPASGGQAPDMGAFEFAGVALPDIFQPRIDSVQINPRADQCARTPRNVSVFARDNALGRGIDSLWLTYTIDSIAQPRILLTRASGTSINGVWTGVLPAAPSAGQIIRAQVQARDSAANLSREATVGAFRDDYLVLSAGNDTTILAGDSVILRASGSNGAVGTLGDPTLAASTSCAGGFLFDMRAVTGSIFVRGFDLLPNNTGSQTVNVFYRLGTKDGFQTNQSAWIQEGSYTINPASNSAPFTLNLTSGFTIPAGAIVGVYLQYNSRYATGNTNLSNAELTITNGEAMCTNWTVCCSPRSWVGRVYYGSPVSRSWRDLAGTTLQQGDTMLVRPMVTTTYVLFGTDSMCTKRDTVTVFVTPVTINDVSLEQILSPVVVNALFQPVSVKVAIRNNGNVPATNFDVAYRVVGGPEINANAIARTLQPNDTMHHTFSLAWTPTAGGDTRLSAYIRWVDDMNSANDTAFTQFNAVGVEEVTNLLRNVYPNPADQFVKFDFGTADGNGTLEIQDQLGRVVCSRFIDLSHGAVHEVRTTEFAAGIYNYRFVQHNKVQHGQVVIRR